MKKRDALDTLNRLRTTLEAQHLGAGSDLPRRIAELRTVIRDNGQMPNETIPASDEEKVASLLRESVRLT